MESNRERQRAVESGSERGWKERVEGVGNSTNWTTALQGQKTNVIEKNRENSSWLVLLDNWFTFFF